MDKLACMNAFVTVVEAGGFSEAARRLGVSKALISKQVSQLEESLDVRLLHRTTRRVSATSTGQAYFERCRPLLKEFDELDDAMQFDNSNPTGQLRIEAPVTFAELHLISVISAFSRRYPDITLNIDLTDHIVDLVEERIDVGIRIGALPDSSLVARKLGDITMLVCATPAFLRKHGEPTRPQQLSNYECVVDSNYPGGRQWTLGIGKKTCSVEVTPSLTVNSARAARELVLAGHGISLLPSFVVTEDLRKGKLLRLFSNYCCEPVGFYAVYPHRKHLSAKVRLFIDTAVEHFKSGFVA